MSGARELGEIYKEYRDGGSVGNSFVNKTSGRLTLTQQGFDRIYSALYNIANKNEAAKTSIEITPVDVKIGNWDAIKYDEDVGTRQADGTILPLDPKNPNDQNLVEPDAVRVIARRTGVSTFFAKIFNSDTVPITSKKAIAALSAPSVISEGKVNTPFALASCLFPDNCEGYVEFQPTKSSCAGWHTFTNNDSSSSGIEALILGLIEGHQFEGDDNYTDEDLLDGHDWLLQNFDLKKTPDPIIAPSISAGDDVFFFNGGTLGDLMNSDFLDESDYDGNTGSVLDKDGDLVWDPDDIEEEGETKEKNQKMSSSPSAITALFDYFKYRDNDGDDSVWTATVPVYLDTSSPENCINPNQTRLIVGFAEIVVQNVHQVPTKNMEVYLPCDPLVVTDRGSGMGSYGNLFGLFPSLVK